MGKADKLFFPQYVEQLPRQFMPYVGRVLLRLETSVPVRGRCALIMMADVRIYGTMRPNIAVYALTQEYLTTRGIQAWEPYLQELNRERSVRDWMRTQRLRSMQEIIGERQLAAFRETWESTEWAKGSTYEVRSVEKRIASVPYVEMEGLV